MKKIRILLRDSVKKQNIYRYIIVKDIYGNDIKFSNDEILIIKDNDPKFTTNTKTGCGCKKIKKIRGLLGLYFYGQPFYNRIIFRIKEGYWKKEEGCGCLVFLKDRWDIGKQYLIINKRYIKAIIIGKFK